MDNEFQHGSRQDHIATLKRAKKWGMSSIWSGDIRRNSYMRENMNFAEKEKIFKLTPYVLEQESGWRVEWLPNSIIN